MNKRISSLLLCLAVIAVMLASAVPVLAAESSCTYTVEADKTTAIPGRYHHIHLSICNRQGHKPLWKLIWLFRPA